MDSIKKTDNSNIPSSILVKGVSHDDFNKLLNELKTIIIEDGVDKINNYDKVIKNNPNEEWKESFIGQVEESSKIIKEEYDKIENLFNRIFSDWEKYQQEHVTVLEDVVDEEDTQDIEEETGDIDE